MKILKRVSALLLLCGVLTAGVACGETPKTEEPYDTSLAFNFRRDEKTAVNPLIYGQFIEHIENCIYDGIWAEKVLDRKFYYEVGDAGLSPWSAKGTVSSTEENTLSGGHAAVISASGSIKQSGIACIVTDYSGYFWCSTPTGCSVKITLSSEDGSADTTVNVPKNSGFTKYTYALSCPFRSSQTDYTFEVTGGEGIFDSLSLMPADNYHGMRQDTLNTLKELGATFYRWPGGNFLSGYDWQDGVGEIDKRPSRRNLHYLGLESDFDSEDAQIASDMVLLRSLGFYGGIEPNDYGLDEFLLMCEYLDAEPLMMVNDGLGTAEEAAAQVEYCNGSVNTEYGAMRARNGHAAPYDIRYWGVGNEMFGDWQLGHIPQKEYPARHNAFVNAMKQKDADIVILASGENVGTWDDTLFSQSGGNFDYICEHLYGQQDSTDVFTHINNLRTNLQGRISSHRSLLQKYPAQKNVKIAFTEYAYDKADCPSRLKDGMGVGAFMNEIIRNADVVAMCSYSSTVNATQGCVTTEPDGAVMQGAGYTLSLYRKYMQQYALTGNIRWDKNLQLDAVLTVSEDGKTYALSVVNPSEYAVRITNVLFEGAEIARYSFTGDYYDSYNTTQRAEMYTTEDTHLAEVVSPAMSVSVFVIQV